MVELLQKQRSAGLGIRVPVVAKKFLQDAGVLTLQRVVQRLAGLCSLYFVVRHLSQADFGNYQLVGIAIATVAFMSLPGMDNALMQSISRGGREFYRKAVAVSLRYSFLGALLLLAASLTMHFVAPNGMAPLIVAAVFFPFFRGLAQWKSVLLAERRFLLLAYLEGFTSVATHGLLIAAVFLGITSPWIYGVLYLSAGAICNVLISSLIWFKTPNNTTGQKNDELYQYGISTSVLAVASIIAEQIEKLSIFVLISPITLAVYIAGDRISELVRGVFQDAAAVLAPRFAKMETYDAQTARSIWGLCLVMGVGIVVFAFTFAAPLLIAIFGDEYRPSIPFAQALLCSVAIGNVGQFQFRYIRSQPDTSSFRAIILWTSGIRIFSTVTLVYFFGVWGAVASVFLHRLAVSVLSSSIVRRQYSDLKSDRAGDLS